MSINTSRIYCSLSIHQKHKNVKILRTKYHFFSSKIWYGRSDLESTLKYSKVFTLWICKLDVNWTYIRHSKDVLDIFCTSYVRSIYILQDEYKGRYLSQSICELHCQYSVFMNNAASQNFLLFWKMLSNQSWFLVAFH